MTERIAWPYCDVAGGWGVVAGGEAGAESGLAAGTGSVGGGSESLAFEADTLMVVTGSVTVCKVAGSSRSLR